MATYPTLALILAGGASRDLSALTAGRWLADTRSVVRLRATTGPLETRLRRHGLLALAVARFVPGTRLPVFLASGIVRTPLLASSVVIVATTLAWTPVLFFLGFGAGEHVLAVLTPATVAAAASLVAERRQAATRAREEGQELAHRLATARAALDTARRRLIELDRLAGQLDQERSREAALAEDAAAASAGPIDTRT